MSGQMNLYKVEFVCESRVNRLPDAQTVFGSLCQILKSIYGESSLEEYLHSFDSEPWLIHSSMYPEKLYPMIKKSLYSVGIVNHLVKNAEPQDQLKALSDCKKYKKIRYISEKLFQDYILSDQSNKLNQDIMETMERFNLENNILQYSDENLDFKSETKLSTRVTIDKMDRAEGKERSLFYDTDLFLEPGQKLYMLVRSSKPIEELEQLFSWVDYFPMGKRGSTGKDLFRYLGVKQIQESSNAKYKILLSKCLPQEDDFVMEKSYYTYTTAMYRSAKAYQNHIIGTIRKIDEGSLMYTQEQKPYYGKVLPIQGEQGIIYHYGIGFVI